jgi:SET domain-containing protein
MTEKKLLTELSETYIMLTPSVLHGIGVFAIKDISKGYREIFSKPKNDWIKISRSKINQLPPYSIELVENYCLSDDNYYYVPDYGFKIVDLVNFLNHSESPNIISVDEGNYFEAMRDIKAGEELLIDYREIDQ